MLAQVYQLTANPHGQFIWRLNMDDYIATATTNTTTTTNNWNTGTINWSTVFNPANVMDPLTVTVTNTLQEKMEQSIEKIDKHVDQLEEDIDFFNNKRLEHDVNIEYLMQENAKKDKNIADLQIKVEKHEKQIISLTSQLAAVYQLHTA